MCIRDRVSGSMGSMVGSGSIGRNISSGGGLSVPGLTSRLNMSTNTGSGSLGVQGPTRLSSGVLQQGITVKRSSLCYFSWALNFWWHLGIVVYVEFSGSQVGLNSFLAL